MAINFTTYFTALGKAAWLLKLINEFRGSGDTDVIATDIDTEWEDYVEKYDGLDNELREIVKSLPAALTSAKASLSPATTAIKSTVQNLLIERINDDNKQSDKTLTTAVIELISQMETASEDIDVNTVTATPSYSTASGSTNSSGVVASVVRGDGLNLQYCKAEDIIITPTSATSAGVKGEHAGTGDIMREDYNNVGSGASTTLTIATDGILTDGQMENWTATTGGDELDSWTTVVGDDTSILKEETNFFNGAAAAKYLGDGAELTSIKQALTGLEAKTPYALIVRTRIGASAPAAGVLKIELVDDTGAAVTSDEESTANSLTIDLTAETTSYATHTAVFRLKEPLPVTPMLYIRLTTALTSAKYVYIDTVGLVKMTQAYAGGPYLAMFAGDDDWSVDDKVTVAVTNNENSEMARWCERLLDLRASGLQLPYDGSPTQADSLIA
jgi:hypothetical protein